MITLKLEDGDIQFEMVEEDEELVQAVKVVLSTKLGEFELDQTIGLDRGAILGKQFDEEEVRVDIMAALSQDERISAVESLTFLVDSINRTVSINVVIEKEDGGLLEIGGEELAG